MKNILKLILFTCIYCVRDDENEMRRRGGYSQVHNKTSSNRFSHQEKTKKKQSVLIVSAISFFIVLYLIYKSIGKQPVTIEDYKSSLDTETIIKSKEEDKLIGFLDRKEHSITIEDYKSYLDAETILRSTEEDVLFGFLNRKEFEEFTFKFDMVFKSKHTYEISKKDIETFITEYNSESRADFKISTIMNAQGISFKLLSPKNEKCTILYYGRLFIDDISYALMIDAAKENSPCFIHARRVAPNDYVSLWWIEQK